MPKKINPPMILGRLKLDLTDLPEIEYRTVERRVFARFSMPICNSHNSNLILAEELLKIGYIAGEKVEDRGYALIYVLMQNNEHKATASFLQDCLYIVGVPEEVERTYKEFINRGIFYYNILDIKLIERVFKFLEKYNERRSGT